MGCVGNRAESHSGFRQCNGMGGSRLYSQLCRDITVSMSLATVDGTVSTNCNSDLRCVMMLKMHDCFREVGFFCLQGHGWTGLVGFVMLYPSDTRASNKGKMSLM